ncbi:hypothetical protein, partial [Prevotella pallens]
ASLGEGHSFIALRFGTCKLIPNSFMHKYGENTSILLYYENMFLLISKNNKPFLCFPLNLIGLILP